MSNRKQELDKAIKQSMTPLNVAKQVQPQVVVPKTIVKRTVADVIGQAMEAVAREQFNAPAGKQYV
jgi:hypothetical protein